MERNLEEMIRSLEEEKRKIETEMRSETDSKIVIEMREDLKRIEEEIEKWEVQGSLIALEDKKREIEDALKSESDSKVRDEMKADILKIEMEIQEKSNKYGLKNSEDNEQTKLSREDAISKSRELQKALETLENNKQEISNSLTEETDLKIITEINNDLKKIEQEIESKTNELNSLKSIYKISETEMQEKSQPEPTQPTSKPVPPENLGVELTPEEIEALNEAMGLGEKPDSNSEPGAMKGKDEYDWGGLADEQIDDLWAEGITPDSQEYKQAYGNFTPLKVTYKPVVHDIIPESEKRKKPAPKPTPESKPTPPSQDQPFKTWTEELLEKYFSKEEIANLEDKDNALMEKVFEKSNAIRGQDSSLDLSEKQKQEEYQKYMEEREKETKIFKRRLNSYIREGRDRLSQLGSENEIDAPQIALIEIEVGKAKSAITWSNNMLKGIKLAIEKDVLFTGLDDKALYDAGQKGEIDIESPTKPKPLSPGEKIKKISELSRKYKEMGIEDLEKLCNDLPEEMAENIKNGRFYSLSDEEIATVSSKVEEMEEKAKHGPTPPQTPEEESMEDENKTHENRLAKMLGRFGSWITSKGKANRDKVAKSEQEESSLPTPAKEKNIVKRIGKAIGKKVSQWREEVTAYEKDEELRKARDTAEELNETNKEGKETDPTQEVIEGIQEGIEDFVSQIENEQDGKENAGEEQKGLVGFDTRDQGFIKKWMDGTLRKAVRVELADGTRVWLSPDGQKDSQSEKNPFEGITKKERKNRNGEKKSTHKGTVGEEEPKPWEVSDEVKRATDEVGRKAGEQEVAEEVEIIDGKVVKPNGEEIEIN